MASRFRKYLIGLSVLLTIFGSCGLYYPVSHAATITDEVFLRFSSEAIVRGYTARTSDDNFLVGVWPGVLQVPATLRIREFSSTVRPVPSGENVVSNFYQFNFLRIDNPKDPLILAKPYTLAIRYTGDNTKRKVIKYYNDILKAWVPLPSTTDFTNKYVRAITHLPFSPVAVFEENVMQEGRSSYYEHPNYRGEMVAASREYSFGTQLRIENLETGASVVVTVRDYGPDGQRYPERIVDISRSAFMALAPLSRGTIPVRVTPYRPVVLGVSTQQPQVIPPVISSKAAMLIDAKTGRMLYEKNPDVVLPIASLTKLVTASVFLQFSLPWDRIVTYQSEDNAIGSRLQVSAGETMTVKDAFYTSLTGSANNATNTLVRSTGLSRNDFVSRMNARAKSWGTTFTSFDDVTGLSEHDVSTAREYAMMARQALKSFDLLTATTIPAYTFTTLNTKIPHTITNRNKMIDTSWYVTGTKTGYTDEALYTLVARVYDRPTGREVLAVILGSQDDATRYREMNALIDHAYKIL
ncbi:MAG: hypothetical protein A2898_04635 [Candidatus Kerfeldbacteria bacterium RIFCSPLOWO2_01_FULL_48_11]|uniref:Peptidase S11 D-alanyl-D-alanine carboxypeptidase A N-terminal domain-containing protein n=1 Tax=Candidatus Kerfeldbacteria bacterium RIFCSPLOWO2_01_FULL_48_11 TaxID=1798543 RepID=A0A1G2B3P2_9BACT|nr:MAG: D-alanyl-D-alanine endopeptidase [Parcubacteria group bacterium GW2011_GWA2_48_9]KKW16648.1 MAG: D-alanyl-D-alanine endopeptidase [Parcubacteria group bacterium GW2011_GWC2_49_9]OGY82847.1 MAG: hypothetical protein A2898_04635 [Candidatus Kerfeldbacteria bacterium RIFCSPLOWO2_01_FULL_48_11]